MTNASQILAWAPHRTEELMRKAMSGTLNQLATDDWEVLIGKADYRRYTFNDVILAQGAVGEALFIIADGEVRVERSDANGTWQLARLGSGAVFGEMSMLDRSGATANVVADGQVEILTVNGPELEALAAADMGFAARFYKSLATTLSRRLRATNEIVRGR